MRANVDLTLRTTSQIPNIPNSLKKELGLELCSVIDSSLQITTISKLHVIIFVQSKKSVNF